MLPVRVNRAGRLRGRLLGLAAVPGLLIALGSVAQAASNLPTGGVALTPGTNISTSSPTQMQITSTTAHSAISWNDFSIGQGYGVDVAQPNAAATQLEQVRGTNISQIFGSLTSNGRVVIANRNGVWFGPKSQVDVAGLLATTAHATDSDIANFAAGGDLSLSQPGNPTAAVVNQGHITISDAGLGAFVAPGVSNDGVIQAKLGTVQLASGITATLDFYGDGLIDLAVSGQTLQQAIDPSTGKPLGASVTNAGSLSADGGTVLVTANVAADVVDDVINNSGVIEAQSFSQHNGEIVLNGGANGTVEVAGTVNASGTSAGQTGGSIQVLGQNVDVASNTTIDASGDQAGGTVYIGGGPHGQGTAMTASTVSVAKGATIEANAVSSGDGGTVTLWSQGHTSVDGTIEAKGGATGGNGGFVETSGAKLTVGGDTVVDTSAPYGIAGDWLLDPDNITIATSGGDISPSTIESALGSGNVEIDTENGFNGSVAGSSGSGSIGNIVVDSPIYYDSISAFSLLAQNNIDIYASIQNSSGGAVNLVAGWDGSTGLSSGSLSGGTVDIGAIESTPGAYGGTTYDTGNVDINNLLGTGTNAVAVGSKYGNTTVLGYDVNLQGGQADAYAQIGYYGPVASGVITVLASSAVTVAGGGGNNAYAQIGNGGYGALSTVPSNGDVSLDGAITVSAVGNIALGGGNGYGSYAQIGQGGYDLGTGQTFNNVSLSGDITVTSQSGSISLGGGGCSDCGGEAYAQIGHGGDGAFSGSKNGDLSIGGAITVSADGNIVLDAGNGYAGYAQIGHGGIYFASDATSSGAASLGGAISVSSSSGAASLNAGGPAAYAQIGHGGDGAFLNASLSSLSVGSGDAIAVLADGDISLNGDQDYAQIGDGGLVFAEGATINGDATMGGAITVGSNSGNVDFGGGDSSDAYTQIGHGGDSAFANGATVGGDASIGGAISVSSSSGTVSLNAGSGTGAYVQIGDGGYSAFYGSTIGGGNGLSIGGAITVSAVDNIDIFGGSGGDAYVQIGHGGAQALVSATVGGSNGLSIGGAIALAADGDVSLNGNAAYAQIGDGGGGFAVNATGSGAATMGGAISVIASGGAISLVSNQDYAQIGHGGFDAFSGASFGSFSVGSGDTIVVSANGEFSLVDTSDYTQIGDGGQDFADGATVTGTASIGGAISVSSNSGTVSLNAGSGTGAYVQIGDGGYSAFYGSTVGGGNGFSIGGAITVSAVDNIDIFGGSGGDAYAQIGHGGYGFANYATVSGGATIGGDIAVDSGAGGVSLSGGSGYGSYAQIGNGGYGFFEAVIGDVTGIADDTQISDDNLGLGGDVTVRGSGNLALAGGADYSAYAQIGNGGYAFGQFATVSGGATIDGNVDVGSGVNLSVTGGSEDDAYAQIGNGGFNSFLNANVSPSYSGGIGVSGGGVLKVTSGDLASEYAAIGNGDPTAGLYHGTVDVFAAGGQIYIDPLASDALVIGPGAPTMVLASGTYGTNGNTISFSSGAPGYNLIDLTLSGSITIDNSNTTWGAILNPNGNSTNVAFLLSGQNTTFYGDFGDDTTQRIGALSVSGGHNFTIVGSYPSTVYATTFADSNMSGMVDFGNTLNLLDEANLTGNLVGTIDCSSGSEFSCLRLTLPLGGTLDGDQVYSYLYFRLYGDAQNQTPHLPNYVNALSNPNESLGVGGINPQAGCSAVEKKENGGKCPIPPLGSAQNAVNYGNQFLRGRENFRGNL